MRKMFGGGMRQVGVLAAAGLVALRKGPEHLAADHENAALLAGALADLPGIDLDPATVRTNIVIFHIAPELGTEVAFAERLAKVGVLGAPFGHQRVRLVTHRDAPRPQIEEAIARIRECVRVVEG